MADPILAYWWNAKPNFGDAISKRLIEAVSGRPVEWADKRQANLFGVGSLMRIAVRRGAYDDPMRIWGTGMIGPEPHQFGDHVTIGSVRGPLTAEHLGLVGVPYGDPGLLVDRFEPARPKTHALGIVPHHRHLDRMPMFAEMAEKVPGATLIRVDEEDPWETVRQISACEAIASSSLHGLIVADAYGIPNYYLAHNPNNLRVDFKFEDYALSIGRDMTERLTAVDILERVGRREHHGFDYFEGLETIKDRIVEAFPH